MGLKSFIVKIAAARVAKRIKREQQNAVAIQQRLLKRLVRIGSKTRFGRDNDFHEIESYEDFIKHVKIVDYEDIIDYIESIARGDIDVLWPGQPLYFCKSSGTTAGVKYIPVTRGQLRRMIQAARDAILLYIGQTGKTELFDHKMIFLQGSPVLGNHGVIPTGRLSGIVYNHTPYYVKNNRLPSFQINTIDDWEEKVEAIAHETLPEKMGVISGIPPWVVMYFEKLKELSGKEFIKDIFPDFKLFMYGGVNYEPYRHKIESLIGGPVDSIETYPASEGFIAYQDTGYLPAGQAGEPGESEGLLLNVKGGIFYEFIEACDTGKAGAKRIMLADVAIGVNYAIILTTNAGLWAYNIGDTIKFVSKNPYRIVVTGRVKHYISAFGEHVIAEEVELAILNAMRTLNAGVVEFTVAPNVTPNGEAPYHEWFIEFSKEPRNLNDFAEIIDRVIQDRNSYYKDLRKGHVLQQLKIRKLAPGAFVEYMKTQGKLGGQNKVPRLTNDRKIAEPLSKNWVINRG